MKIVKIFLLLTFVVACVFVLVPKQAHQPKVYDCFLFYNELELLEVRLSEMNDYVDKFVLVEAAETFRGKPKPFYYEENKHRFEKFSNKIVHVKLTEPFVTEKPFDRERHQRSQVVLGLKGAHSEDIVFVSDLDEIIRGSKIPEIAQLISSKKAEAAICQMTMYNGYLNRFQTEGWRGSVCSTYKQIKRVSPSPMRSLRNLSPRKLSRAKISKIELIPNAGWHFTSMGGTDRIIQKFESFSHVKFDSPEYKDKQRLLEAVRALPLRPIDETFPRYVQDNQKRLSDIGLIE